jgi:membrane protease YdiL (CAAX protease family)
MLASRDLTGDGPRSPSDAGLARSLRGFGPLGVLSALVILLVGNFPFAPMGALLALLWRRLSRTPWREIGYVRPESWATTAVIGIAFGIALKLVLKTIVMPLLGAPAVNDAYHYLVGNRAALPGAIYLMLVGGGFGEETVYRGFLFERLGKLLGSHGGARVAIVLLSSALFSLAHFSTQGLAGSEQALFTGLSFGTMMATQRRIWLPMFAHASYDLASLALIYLGLEEPIAHLVFA